jgi:hypothetical protein
VVSSNLEGFGVFQIKEPVIYTAKYADNIVLPAKVERVLRRDD